jgi:hypothetical protein
MAFDPFSLTTQVKNVEGIAGYGMDLLSVGLVLSVRERLELHPHFRGRTSLFAIEMVKETIILSGRLPSFYLKQLLQEAVRGVPGVTDIDNRVDVMWPN